MQIEITLKRNPKKGWANIRKKQHIEYSLKHLMLLSSTPLIKEIELKYIHFQV